MRTKAILLVLALTWLGGGALAENIKLLPEGQTLLTLSVTERVRVQQDTLVATLRVEFEDRDSTLLQQEINETMDRALTLAGAVDGLKVSTGFYSVYQYNRQPQGSRADPVWRGAQSLTLEATEAQPLLELSGELQSMGFVMNQLSYNLSPERADEVRDELMETAIARARDKAGRAAQALGKDDVEIAVLDIETAADQAQPWMMRSMSAGAAEMSAPVAEAGESEVTLTVRIRAVAK